MRTLVVVALALALACAVATPLAHADGDPASDYLYTSKVFVPFDVKAPASETKQLTAAVEGAAKAGFPIRVAVIGSPYDLGSVFTLWKKPKLYAQFLGEELAFVYKQRLLIVMPNGFGFYWKSHPATREYAVLSRLRIAAGATGLVTAARDAVQQLAAAGGVHVRPAAAPKSTTARDRAIIAITAAGLIAAAVLARFALRRRHG